MSDLMIKVDNVTKEYRLGAIGGTTLRDEIQRRRAQRRNEEDPTSKIGTKRIDSNEKFMALNGVSFEVRKGEAIGIIGHNGAGKSTLLKLITRITAPTTGHIYLNGRIASMLEVGTGFHPELTGRENVYLNGAILGMTRKEIDAKMEEIIEFSEVRQFIDTPVKRYSSGMYVKLAFSVAAHLDAEIMVMDEVLAVGDVAFQNKCIKKMRQVADSGRTILYVSHNMTTIQNLCDRVIVLDHGTKVFDGNVDDGIDVYLKVDENCKGCFNLDDVEAHDSTTTLRHTIRQLKILESDKSTFKYGSKFKLQVIFDCENDRERVFLKMFIVSARAGKMGVALLGELNQIKGINERILEIDTRYLVPGKYSVNFSVYSIDQEGGVETHDYITSLHFSVVHSEESLHLQEWYKEWGSVVIPYARFVDSQE